MRMLVWLLQKTVYFLKWITLQDYEEEKDEAARRTVDYIQWRQDSRPDEDARRAGM
jgi:hypothetical protein